MLSLRFIQNPYYEEQDCPRMYFDGTKVVTLPFPGGITKTAWLFNQLPSNGYFSSVQNYSQYYGSSAKLTFGISLASSVAREKRYLIMRSHEIN
jgi:hypothetical protein